MSVEVIGLFAAGTGGTENATAQIDIPQDGFILGIDWDMYAIFDANNESIAVELSFIATNQLLTNDVRGRISSISAFNQLLTSGIHALTVQKYVDIKELTVSGGERLYLHLVSVAGVISTTRCNIHFEMTGGSTRRSARRR